MLMYGWSYFLAQPEVGVKAAPSGPWDVLSPTPPSTPQAPSPRIFDPGANRRDLSGHFRELRSQYNERHKLRAGDRLPQLLGIVERGDARGLDRFVEVARSSKKVLRSQGCAWCNARLALRPTQAQKGVGFRVAKECELCLSWHCGECCAFTINLGGGSTQARRGSRAASKPISIECCAPCCRLFDVVLWQQESPPKSLPASSAALTALHQEIAAGLTSFVSALAQLEGLTRMEEICDSPTMKSVANSPTRKAFSMASQEALRNSLAGTAMAKTAVELALRRLADVPCHTPKRDTKLKEELIRHGKLTLTDCDCRLWAVELRLEVAGTGMTPSRPQPQNKFFPSEEEDSVQAHLSRS